MPLAAGIGISAGANLLGSWLQNRGASNAARLQEARAREGLQTSRERTLDANNALQQYGAGARGYLDPFAASGVSSLDSLINGIKGGASELNRPFTLADFQKDPGYDFRMQQGEQGLERNAASRGSVLGGGQLKALERYRQGFASNEYAAAEKRFTGQQERRFGQLFDVAGLGAGAASQQAGLMSQEGRDIAGNVVNQGQAELDTLTGIGNVQGAGAAARGQAWGNALQNIGNNVGQAFMLKDYLKNVIRPTGGATRGPGPWAGGYQFP